MLAVFAAVAAIFCQHDSSTRSRDMAAIAEAWSPDPPRSRGGSRVRGSLGGRPSAFAGPLSQSRPLLVQTLRVRGLTTAIAEKLT